MDSPQTVPAVELRLSISGTEPLIWRQLVLPESATLAELHGAIQCAFGWRNSHLYAVAGHDRSGKKRLFMDVDDGDGPEGAENPAAVRLLELFDPQKPGASDLLYEYDFGDSWTHDIEVVGPAELHENTIACLDGDVPIVKGLVDAVLRCRRLRRRRGLREARCRRLTFLIPEKSLGPISAFFQRLER